MPDKQFAIQAGALRAAVAIAGAATERRNTIPVLEHLYLSATAGKLLIIGSDCDSWARATAGGDGELDPLTASASRLAGILALLPPEETVTLNRAPAGHLNLVGERLKAKLFTLPAQDFPSIPSRSWSKRWTIAAGKLRNLFDRTAHAISTEETRYYLNGVFLSVAGEGAERKLHATATDGHRLMLASESLPTGDEPASLIVSRKAVHTLRAFLARVPPEQLVRVKSDDGTLDFDAGGWTFITKAIDGTYPDFWRVIPEELTGEPLKVADARRFADAIRTTRAISSAKSQPIRLGVGEGMAARMTVKASDQGMTEECEIALPADVAAWGSNNANPSDGHGYQARYLLDVCGVFRNGFEIRVGTDASRISGPEGLAVLMPMRV